MTVVSGILDDGNRHLDRRRKALSYLLGPDLDPRFPLEGLTVVPTARDALFLALPDQEPPQFVQRHRPPRRDPAAGHEQRRSAPTRSSAAGQ